MQREIISPEVTQLFGGSIWIVELLLGVLFLVVINYSLKFLVTYLSRRAVASTGWKEKFEQVIYLPAKIILWIVGVSFALNVVSQRFDLLGGAHYLNSLRNASITVCVAWMLVRWKNLLQLKCKTIDEHTLQLISRFSSFAIFILATLFVLQSFEVNVMPLIAFGGVGAAALGFAAKDVIGNFFGGLMLHLTRPFTVGDWILLPDRNIEGSVEKIGWYYTSILDDQKRPVYLPNFFFSTLLVMNASRRTHRRFIEEVHLRFEDIDKAPLIVEAIKSYLVQHASIDKKLSVIVAVDAFEEFSIQLKVDLFCFTRSLYDFRMLREEILMQIYTIIRQHDADIPFPTSVNLMKSL